MENHLTPAQHAIVRAELRAQRDGMKGRADLMTRLDAARDRYAYNPTARPVARRALALYGLACVLAAALIRRPRR